MIAFIFDTETSGLIDNRVLPIEKQPELVEFYGCSVDLASGEVLSELDTLVRPKRPVSDEITRITGLTNEDLVAAPSFEEVADRIAAAIEGSPRVLAHNLSFDMEMIDLEFERIGRKIAWPRRKICTVEATVHISGFRQSLTGLHTALFGEGFPSAHRARNDVAALVRCAVELFRRGEL